MFWRLLGGNGDRVRVIHHCSHFTLLIEEIHIVECLSRTAGGT
jgi:hypothetical protein